MKLISRLQYITTNAAHAEQACKGGVDWIQLRLKGVDYAEYRKVALEVQAVCKKYNAKLIINDNVALAMDIYSNGVHLGKEDMFPEDARGLLGDGFIIGCTANTYEEVAELSAKEIDYIGLGPFRYTTTKANLKPILGLDGYINILTKLKNNGLEVPPIVGIGGVDHADVPGLMETGLHGLAISGAISNLGDVVLSVNQFNELINSSIV